jgi:hypothetical protein
LTCRPCTTVDGRVGVRRALLELLLLEPNSPCPERGRAQLDIARQWVQDEIGVARQVVDAAARDVEHTRLVRARVAHGPRQVDHHIGLRVQVELDHVAATC